jgi:hypothetical protein
LKAVEASAGLFFFFDELTIVRPSFFVSRVVGLA